MPFFRFDVLPAEVVDGTAEGLGPGEGFVVPPNVPHRVTAIEDSEVLSCKGLVESRGHRI